VLAVVRGDVHLSRLRLVAVGVASRSWKELARQPAPIDITADAPNRELALPFVSYLVCTHMGFWVVVPGTGWCVLMT
jgi:hypothetical protein